MLTNITSLGHVKLAAAVLVGAAFMLVLPSITNAAAPTGASAVVTNSTATTVDVVVTGTDFDAFESSDTATADVDDRANITYRGANPTAAVVTNATTLTLTFAIAIGTDMEGDLTIAAGTVEDAANANNLLITIDEGAITDTAAPQYSASATIDNNGDGTVDYVRVTYTEAVSDASIVAGDFAVGIADTTAGNLVESFASLTPSTGTLTDTADDAVIYIGVASGDETISTLKTDYTLKVEQVGSISDGTTALASFTSKTSTDGARPVVASVTPADDATDLGVDASLAITFSEAMDDASVTFATNPAVTYAQVWSGGDKIVTFTHEASPFFEKGRAYTATVTAADAAAGTSVTLQGLPYDWTFEIRASSGGGGGGSSSSSGGSRSSSRSTDTTPGKSMAELQTMIADLMARIAAMKGEVAPAASGSFTMDLDLGASGADVTRLQNWLIGKGFAIEAGATGYFGAQTQGALAAYQASAGISPAVGYFGPLTRAKVNGN